MVHKTNCFPIADLHCDLLSYLAVHDGRTPHDLCSRSAISQLQAGGVKLQTLAIGFMTTPSSVREAEVQMSCFQQLLNDYSDFFAPCTKSTILKEDSLIHILPAFENASGFALEDEPLDTVFERLQKAMDSLGSVFYISLTWNGENRFGGGVGSERGLKPDGEELLKWLSHKRIAVDFSHTSDRLALDILHFIDKHGLDIPLIASHSNYRAVSALPRNLPEEFVHELIRREGLIGLNFFAPFIGDKGVDQIRHHVEYALKLGAENALCFGADFFCTDDFPHLLQSYPSTQTQSLGTKGVYFFPECENASGFPYVLNLLQQELHLKDDVLYKVANENTMRFLVKNIL